MSHSFVIYTQNFKGKPAFVVSCDDRTLEWMAESFVKLNQGKRFVTGDDSPIASDKRCIIYVESSDDVSSPEIREIGGGRFRWVVPAAITTKYSNMIGSMIVADHPCHQYLLE